MHMLPLLLLFSAAASATTPTFKPPPLGFSSWNKFGMGITAPVLLEVADAFASSGLQAAGYLYLCTDDGWMDLNRSAATGPSTLAFPSYLPFVSPHKRWAVRPS